MQLAKDEIHCHVWHDLDRQQLKSTYLIPQTLALYPDISGEIRKASDGKPFLSNSGCQISVSHSRQLAVVAMTSAAPLGCDIEFHRTRRFTRIGQSYFHANEASALERAFDSMALFYSLWTVKEAFGKAIGTGMSGALGRDFSKVIEGIPTGSNIDEMEDVRLVRVPDLPEHGFLGGQLAPDFSLAIAVETRRPDWRFCCWHHYEAALV